MRQPLKHRIVDARDKLQASQRDMARLLGVNYDTYIALERGGRILPVPAQKAVTKRLERLLSQCGME